MNDHRPFAVIIGMPGAGKTRVGREAAKMLGLDFADSDYRIEREIGMTIPEYFKEYGEPAFRETEADVIANLLDSFDGLLALGGGAPMTESTRHKLAEYVESGGRLVYLEADKREAMQRAARAGGRPMLDGDANERWKSLYEQRDPVFRDIANMHVHTHGSTPRNAARKLSNMINERIIHITGSGIEPYDVCIGEGALNQLPEALGEGVLRVALIHTTPVQRHSDQARALLRQAGYEVYDIVIPDAEKGKTIEVANGVWARLGQEGFTRSDAIVGLGGGAATDLAGFVAATWMRGIRYVNCPTSLLAMVDASTGGKTGINTEEGKNLVGSFYTPAAVLADLRTLKTLPQDIFIEGLGEVAKSGFIRDTKILDILQEHAEELRDFNGDDFLGSPLEDVVAELIERTVRVKAYHVSSDLREAGLREFLNYGHTLAHAIEKLEHFRWRHGNAVAVGCVYAAELSHILGHIDLETVDLHRSIFSSLGLPISWDGGTWDEVLALMHKDKKARGNTLRFIILDAVGKPMHLVDPPMDALEEAFARIRG
ncbi:bifunctional shikimate kinase/3-dehydroquinate synthase [Bifidobacterium sp. ESL0790]|uniref:bifunctional shikimate kinase/3-dehydroquinate synthase n=1 Tax=Bifidobacterium sp. ESL0790 TaxID=2983233 RepID=UPI0023F659F9|nr:bifunctional shikimate kinase/3-dehydroquinate synthase [Bifidobacterium sp. ESL0790]WEV73092.1 bifunctional shikimate kinase/3-dehydroquinate synthase [Bifidobacterium sp. ESL0790]